MAEADSEAAIAGRLQLITLPAAGRQILHLQGSWEAHLCVHHKHLLGAKNFSRWEGYSREQIRCKKSKIPALMHFTFQ